MKKPDIETRVSVLERTVKEQAKDIDVLQNLLDTAIGVLNNHDHSNLRRYGNSASFESESDMILDKDIQF